MTAGRSASGFGLWALASIVALTKSGTSRGQGWLGARNGDGMRAHLKIGLLAAGLGLASGTVPFDRAAVAAVEDGMSAVRGVGMLSCGQYITLIEEESPAIDMVAGWIDGFTTGLNATTPGVFDHLPWQRTDLVLQLLANHCAANQNDILANALNLFIHATAATRLTEPSDPIQIPLPDGGGSIDVYQATLARAQRMLAELGHYNSTVDGLYGPGTAAAIRAFQAEIGIPENGLPDQRTLLALFASTFQGVN